MARRTLPNHPDDVRMSFGDHLEELRACVIRALVGVVLSVVVCFHFGDHIISLLTAPYYAAMLELGFDPQMVQLNPIDSFKEYFTIALEFGVVLAMPWALFQLWRFVATGLYPAERRYVRALAPASIGLFVTGAAFMIGVVLFGLLKFLIGISSWFPMPSPEGNFLTEYLTGDAGPVTTQPYATPLRTPVLNDDPADPQQGDVWIRRSDNSFNVFVDGKRYTTTLKQADKAQFVQPLFSIADYLGFVTGMALAFGLGFQIPIVVIFLIVARIVSSAAFGRGRRYIFLVLALGSAVLTPSPDVSSMMMLMVPMMILFESGVLIGRLVERRRVVGE